MAVFYESYYGVSSLGSNDYLMHHGVKGMKWGVRRYQNADGSLTAAGRAKYLTSDGRFTKAGQKRLAKEEKKLAKLEARTDIGLQKEKAEKYERRSGKALSAMRYSAGGVVGSYLSKYPLIAMTKKLVSDKNVMMTAFNKRKDANMNAAYKAVHQVIDKPGWYNHEGNHEKLDRIQEQANKSFDRYDSDLAKARAPLNKRRDNILKAYKVREIAGKVSLAALGVSSGVYAYNKIQGKRATYRTTKEGHAEAVAAYKKQAERVKKLRASVKLSDLRKAG